MTCTLTIIFSTPGYNGGTDTESYTVPDGSYVSPYTVARTDLGNNGADNNVYDVRCDGDTGIIVLATYYPGAIHPTVSSASNSCPVPTYTYDCINGTCKPSSVHGTDGLYASLSECQLSCGSHGCSGQCVSSSDWAQIEGLVDQLKRRSCG